MKVVDELRMLLNGQSQGSSGLNSNPIKLEAEAEVREQSTLDFVESALLPSSFFLIIAISYNLFFLLLSSLLLGSNPSHESGG